MGPFPRSSSGYTQILVVSDWFTKYTLIFPLRAATAKAICRIIENEVFLIYGVPQSIVCDNAKNFAGNELRKLVEKYKSRLIFTPYYHPQTNYVERQNRTIGTAIRSYIKENHKHWDQELSKIGFALRTSVHKVTGYSPALLTFGRELPGTGTYYGKSNDQLDLGSREYWGNNLGNLKNIYVEVQQKIIRHQIILRENLHQSTSYVR